MICPKVRFLFALLCAPCPTLAQTANVPANVNDCTLIQDPVELRNCVLRFEGNRVPPPNVVESYGARPNAAQTETADPGIAREEAGTGLRLRGRRPAANPPAAASRPSARDTLISIEQIPPASKPAR